MQFALMSGLVAFLATVLLIPRFITFYQAKRIEGQQMHEDVKQHQFKAGTPTMGNSFSRCCDSCQLVVCNGLSTVDGWCPCHPLHPCPLWCSRILDDF